MLWDVRINVHRYDPYHSWYAHPGARPAHRRDRSRSKPSFYDILHEKRKRAGQRERQADRQAKPGKERAIVTRLARLQPPLG
ncbi:MAG: hypothetical protein E6230_10140 [Paenibacillus dendritiformis]|uniref:hypothetical protein n=1 Tax=Paenibacillus dendritiformis TaxID=130049 RepID=UPI00143D3CDD|nr:hypothetical protein [Paenibacillus dendritiformis]MDU5142536.1 hypothetical protein [Paenibacillus dendritiformis]NKI23810.1 hypothetical protein [Paenibacillus dendritiformis]NRF96912.1 hypothetical protein [Paenibacillus dendritiformis]GIO74685.1 hypothetical protein J27TS7_41990 [Paenibacillus dendritiformis]